MHGRGLRWAKSSHGDVALNRCTPTVGTASRNRLGSPLVRMALLEGQGPSARHEVFYFGGAELGAVRVGDMKFIFYQQPAGWSGPKMMTNMPGLVNIRHRAHPGSVRRNRRDRRLLVLRQRARGAWRFVEGQQLA